MLNQTQIKIETLTNMRGIIIKALDVSQERDEMGYGSQAQEAWCGGVSEGLVMSIKAIDAEIETLEKQLTSENEITYCTPTPIKWDE